jgi:RNA polymerase sigma factor (sigma-70 family)
MERRATSLTPALILPAESERDPGPKADIAPDRSLARGVRRRHVVRAAAGGILVSEPRTRGGRPVPTSDPPVTGHDPPEWPSRAALVEELRGGGRDALDRAVTLLYGELREIAHRLRLGRSDRTMDTLSLVHETYLKLAEHQTPVWNDRAHFLALAAVVMRHVLTDDARARLASKREGKRVPVALDENALASKREGKRVPVALDENALAAPERPHDLLDVSDALERLERADERLAHVVEYRFFGGLTNEEIGLALGVDARTVRRDWARARVVLRDALAP